MTELLSEGSANAETDAPVNAGEVDSNPADTGGADPAPAGAETAKPERDKVQERFDKLTREKYEGLSRAERAEYRAQLLEQQLAELKGAAKPETVAPSDEFPTLESVGWDEAEHRKAVDAYYDRKFEAKAEAVLSKKEQAAQRQQAETAWQRKLDTFIESKPDYDEKVGALPLSLLTKQVQDEIQDTGNPEVAYYLAEHPEKLAEIARLPANALSREIGRIEARIEAAKASPPPVSKAPPPPAKIDVGGSVASVDLGSEESNNLSADEWNRRMELKERRKRSKA